MGSRSSPRSVRLARTVSKGQVVRVGTGAGYSGSRVEPAVEIAESGQVDYLIFECLGERTVALAQQSRYRDAALGFDPYLDYRMPRVLAACMPRQIGIVSNMGAANPPAAADRIRSIASDIGFPKCSVGVVTGDDVLAYVRDADVALANGLRPSQLGDRLVAANAYIGAEPIVTALDLGVDIVITGRVADPSLFLAPLMFRYGWASDDWSKLGMGTVVGHLIECSSQVTGGFIADPGYVDVPNLARIGFPIAEVREDGVAVITKVDGSGGLVSRLTCAAQLLYEIGDPGAYLTPDVTADFTEVELREVGPDRVQVTGGAGRRRPDLLKVTVGYLDGYIGEGQISYGGPGAVARAQLAAEVLRSRFEITGLELDELRIDLVGVDALFGDRIPGPEPAEVRVRVAARAQTWAVANEVGHEVEAMYATGPSAGGGVSRNVREVLAVTDAFIPRTAVTIAVQRVG
jgi:hypothetical protein